MGVKIAILDDEPERIAEMGRCLARCGSGCEVIAFDNAPDMVAWLADHLESVQLIGLDHDLGPTRMRDDAIFDPGTGRDVADWLAERAPACPILIHTTNAFAAPGMVLALESAGWRCARVSPYGDLDWVAEVWVDEASSLMNGGGTDNSGRQPQGRPAADQFG